MTKKKKPIRETATTVMIDGVPITPYVEDPTFTTLRTRLVEINKIPGVTGYILRNTTSATIDLENQDKLGDYAILSTQAVETSEELSELFTLGKVNYIIVEGKKHKVLCMILGENKVNIFMENGTDPTAIIEQLSQ